MNTDDRNMYIIGIDRADLQQENNLNQENPPTLSYKIAIANKKGKLVKAYSHASRKLLGEILNNALITHPCVWSQKEFDIIKNLTNREITILQDYHIQRNSITKRKEEVTPMFIFNRMARTLSNNRIVSEEEAKRFTLPKLQVYKDNNGRADFWLSALCYNTILLAKLQTYDDLFD